MGRSWGAPALRQASVHDEMACGCIPYEHVIHGPCTPPPLGSMLRSALTILSVLALMVGLALAARTGLQTECRWAAAHDTAMYAERCEPRR